MIHNQVGGEEGRRVDLLVRIGTLCICHWETSVGVEVGEKSGGEGMLKWQVIVGNLDDREVEGEEGVRGAGRLHLLIF